jgi:hypothetical protein
MVVAPEVVAASRTTNLVAFLNMDLTGLVDPLSCGLVHGSRLTDWRFGRRAYWRCSWWQGARSWRIVRVPASDEGQRQPVPTLANGFNARRIRSGW